MKPDDRFAFLHTRIVKSVIFCGTVLLIFAFILLRYEGFFKALSTIGKVFRPLVLGLIIAFALNLPFAKLEQLMLRLFGRLRKKKGAPPRLCNILALILTYVLTILIVAGIICVIIPQLISSVRLFLDNFDLYSMNLEHFIENNRDSIVFDYVEDWNLEEKLKGLTDYIPNVLLKTVNYTTSFFGAIVDFVIGVVFSVYILADKRTLKRQVQKLCRTMVSQKRYRKLSEVTALSVETFSGFLTGQLVEAFAIGVFCFIGMSLLGFDYPVLVSVIIGLTNVIPIVGPIIGTIPCGLILLLVNPKQVIPFVIFVIVLQQLESNLLYPRVVGSSVGLPAIWVLAAVTVGGGLGGVLGMVIGIPVFSIVYAMLRHRVQNAPEPEDDFLDPPIVEEIPVEHPTAPDA